MRTLYERLAGQVTAWRAAGYPSPNSPTVGEILEWAHDPDSGQPRFLRTPQLRALETYWYLRVVANTPHVMDLYTRLFPEPAEMLEALGVTGDKLSREVINRGVADTLDRIRTDDDFARDFKLEALRETLTLGYPSYIFALAMGAGKTILIGAIVATEFAMAIEDPDGPYVQNALVFAPGKTILESLRELVDIPYERILPPRLHKTFAASVKLTFTRDGERDLPVVRGSLFNVVVTNTEKIRTQKETVRKRDLGSLLAPGREDEARAEVANLRLQAIASLPHLAVFSDEAHHTYGQSLDTGLKKVRKTVDYLAAKTNLVVVVNTTGTPFFQRQPLRDVVIWYGLAEGIRDGILKDVAGNIQAYEFEDNTADYVRHVVEDFFETYGDVRLPNGAGAKLAIYFPQTDDLKELKPTIDEALVRVGLSPAVALVNTSDTSLTSTADIDAFNRLNDPRALHRVVLLVNKGTEGWNCPSLFACALARKLRRSNNFVLQAATRCLRQVPGNDRPARIYLSSDNRSVLDRQLQETYGETITELNRAGRETRRARLVLRKRAIPDLVVTQLVRRLVARPRPADAPPLRLVRPARGTVPELTKAVLTVAESRARYKVLQQVGDAVTIETASASADHYTAAAELAGRYRLDPLELRLEIGRIYGGDDVPLTDLVPLASQIEAWRGGYDIEEERVDVALALVKPEGFRRELDADGTEVYTAEIVYHKDREHLLMTAAAMAGRNPADYGFHYTPYDFDSRPEWSLYEQLLDRLNLEPADIEDLYFTGSITDPARTDFFVEYKDEHGKWRRYTPDFVIRKRPAAGGAPGTGRTLLVEVKAAQFEATITSELAAGRAVSREGRKALAVRKWQELDPDRLRYEIVFTKDDTVAADRVGRLLDEFEETP